MVEVEQGRRDRLLVLQDMPLVQMPAAWPHDQGRRLIVQRIPLAFVTGKTDFAPDRVAQIKADYEKRRERLRRNRRVNPLSANSGETIDDVYGIDEASSSCVICHK